MSKLFVKFASCPIVQGYTRDVIYDLDRNNFEFIPKSLTEFIYRCEGKSREYLYGFIKRSKEKAIYKEYLQFLIKNEFVFFCDEKSYKNFKKPLTEKFDIPYHLKTIIIQYNRTIDYSHLLYAADKYNIPTISFDLSIQYCEVMDVELVLNWVIPKSFYAINVKLNDSQFELISEIDQMSIKCNFHLFIYMPITANLQKWGSDFPNINFRHYSQGDVEPIVDFIVNYDFYYEALHKNPFYNRKLFVNKDGIISTADGIGFAIDKIDNRRIDFFKIFTNDYLIWNISKKEIATCNVCEFRLMCCTNKLPININGQWQYDGKCNYDPYSAEWSTIN